MRHEVANFVKSCDTCQKTKPVNRKELAGRNPISGLFHTYCIYFAGPLPRTNVGSQYLIVAVDHMAKWAVAWGLLTELFNSLVVMKFIRKEIIMALGPQQHTERQRL